MPSTPTTSLRLELQQTGEALNQWGERLNQALQMVEQAVCGVLIKPLTGNVTLQVQNYVSDEARNATLVFTAGSGLSAAPTVTIPAAAKSWHVDNRCGYPITFTNGGTTVTVPVGRQADVFSDGANLFMLEPIAAASAVTQAFADQAAVSAQTAMTSASTATTRRDQALAARDETYAARDTTLAYRDATLGYRNAAAVSATQAAGSAAQAAATVVQSQIYPVSIIAPVNGATATATQTFTTRADGYAADTSAFYSLYGFPQASRTLNVYQTSAPSVIFKSQTVAGSGASVTANLQTLGLAVSTQYLAEIVLSDVVGNIQRSSKIVFTTPAVFRPDMGGAWKGGFYTGQVTDGGVTYDEIVSPKSGGEITTSWGPTSVTLSTPSRTNGPGNTTTAKNNNGVGPFPAAVFCEDLSLNGYTDWFLPATDELRQAHINLRQGAAGVPAAFSASGAERFETGPYWSSTEVSSTNAYMRAFDSAPGSDEISVPKSTSYRTRAFRREAA